MAKALSVSRSLSLYSPFNRSAISLVRSNPSFTFPNYPFKLSKFSALPLVHSSMDAPPEGYRRNVGICLVNPSKKIFAASRLDIPDSWQMPQLSWKKCDNGVRSTSSVSLGEGVTGITELGSLSTAELTLEKEHVLCKSNGYQEGGIDEGEDPRVAAVRELREETGVSSAEVLAETPHWLTYDFPPDVREKLKHQWGSDWKGQAQKWFLFKFTGQEEEINLQGDGTEKPEFGEWSWMSPEQIIEHAVDFKKPVYKEVLTVFSPYLQ